jgi:hypothetical protein
MALSFQDWLVALIACSAVLCGVTVDANFVSAVQCEIFDVNQLLFAVLAFIFIGCSNMLAIRSVLEITIRISFE